MAYHLFEFEIKGEKYVIPSEEFDEDEDFDVAWFGLYQFKFNVGDTFTMDYDFGTTQGINSSLYIANLSCKYSA